MTQFDTPTLSLLAQRAAVISGEIDLIFADAERRAAPLRAKLQRLQIAEEELRELDPDQTALPLMDASVSPQLSVSSAPQKKKPVKTLIEEELTASTLPLSKSEFMERFSANGHTVQETTVGSTLSRLLADGLLTKDGANRYRLKAART